MTRREVLGRLVNTGRLSLLSLRVKIGRPLPVACMAALRLLDRWSAERALDKPWTPAASARVDRILTQKDRES